MRNMLLRLLLIVIVTAVLFTGCEKTVVTPPKPEETTVAPDPVTITIAGGWEDCIAIEAVGREFTKKYPNCTVVYEYLQDFYNSLEKRMTGENTIDIFFTTNIQEDSALLPYALDLNSRDDLNLSNVFDGLKENFAFMENGARSNKLYAIPLGAEMRGLFINKTLLNSLGLEVPTDQASLLAACKVLKENGFIPFHGNPGDFSQKLLYPWVCNIIANADDPTAAYNMVNSRQAGISEMLREPYEFIYMLEEKGYYDYKTAQKPPLKLFLDTADLAYSRDFLNIRQNGDTWEKADDIGQVAFLPSQISMLSVMEKTKDDYHSNIDYVFVPAPIGENGGFAYLSPTHGIAANKNSANIDWAVKFLDFLFQPEFNKLYSEKFNIIPNTKEAFEYIRTLYDIPDSNISHLGQVTFDYNFYNIIKESLVDISKANNPSYMKKNSDGTTSMYPLDYYLNKLEESIILK